MIHDQFLLRLQTGGEIFTLISASTINPTLQASLTQVLDTEMPWLYHVVNGNGSNENATFSIASASVTS